MHQSKQYLVKIYRSHLLDSHLIALLILHS